jgi:rsbT co-antagonist protein RsbR
MPKSQTRLGELLKKHKKALASDWIAAMTAEGAGPNSRVSSEQIEGQATEFLTLLADNARLDVSDLSRPEWGPMHAFLDDLSRVRAEQGFTSEQTATFIFSFKQPLFARLRKEHEDEPTKLADETWTATLLLDKLGLATVGAYQRTREGLIQRQQEDLLELSTPVVKLWEGVLALPMIGTLDSARTQVVMESLLQRIVDTGSAIAIIDITGVATVDTVVAQHLIKTVTAIRLMGADAIISGVRPQIAQTIVHLGVDLQGITTKANLADALALALKRSGWVTTRSGA